MNQWNKFVSVCIQKKREGGKEDALSLDVVDSFKFLLPESTIFFLLNSLFPSLFYSLFLFISCSFSLPLHITCSFLLSFQNLFVRAFIYRQRKWVNERFQSLVTFDRLIQNEWSEKFENKHGEVTAQSTSGRHGSKTFMPQLFNQHDY